MIDWLIGLFPHTCVYVEVYMEPHPDITWHECRYCSKKNNDGPYLDIPNTDKKLHLSTGLEVKR